MERAGFHVELEQEDDGRWIADVVDVPGLMVYGATQDEALDRAAALLVRVLADRLEHGEPIAPNSAPASGDFSTRHERLGRREGTAPSRCAPPDRVADQAGVWRLPQILERDGWADFPFAFHDDDEVGPKMLARMAKKTGLRPDDL